VTYFSHLPAPLCRVTMLMLVAISLCACQPEQSPPNSESPEEESAPAQTADTEEARFRNFLTAIRNRYDSLSYATYRELLLYRTVIHALTGATQDGKNFKIELAEHLPCAH
jgi:hypothetical protein